MLATNIRTLAAAFCAAALLLPTSALSQDDAFITVPAPEELKVREWLDASAGTMSGAHRARTRTGTLVASILFTSSGTDTLVEPGTMRVAPLILPSKFGDALDSIMLCTNAATINGHYRLFGIAGPLGELSEGGDRGDLPSMTFETKHSEALEDRYTDASFVGRAYLAPRCEGTQTAYFVPIGFVDEPDTLHMSFEVTAGTIEAKLTPYLSSGKLADGTNAVSMDCQGSRRLEVGFDCSVKIAEITAAAAKQGAQSVQAVQLSLLMKTGREDLEHLVNISLP